MSSVRFGDGELLTMQSFREKIDSIDGIPKVHLKCIPSERLKVLFIQDHTQIDDRTGEVEIIFSKIFILPLNNSKTMWFCTRDFNNRTTKISNLFLESDEKLKSLYKRNSRLQKNINYDEKKIEELTSRPHTSMVNDTDLIRIASIVRTRTHHENFDPKEKGVFVDTNK